MINLYVNVVPHNIPTAGALTLRGYPHDTDSSRTW